MVKRSQKAKSRSFKNPKLPAELRHTSTSTPLVLTSALSATWWQCQKAAMKCRCASLVPSRLTSKHWRAG